MPQEGDRTIALIARYSHRFADFRQDRRSSRRLLNHIDGVGEGGEMILDVIDGAGAGRSPHRDR